MKNIQSTSGFNKKRLQQRQELPKRRKVLVLQRETLLNEESRRVHRVYYSRFGEDPVSVDIDIHELTSEREEGVHIATSVPEGSASTPIVILSSDEESDDGEAFDELVYNLPTDDESDCYKLLTDDDETDDEEFYSSIDTSFAEVSDLMFAC